MTTSRRPREARDREPEREGNLAPVTYLPGVTPPAVRSAAAGPRPGTDGEVSPALPGSEKRPSPAERPDDTGAREPAADPGPEASRGRGARRASNVAVHQLARRGMSRWELEQVLARRGVDDGDAAAELDRLESLGLVDDAALAVTLTVTRHNRKGHGRAAIAQELRRRHIDQDFVDAALAEIDDESERERARELAADRAARLHGLDHETAVRRLSGYLGRRGYSSALVREVVDEALARRTDAVRFR